MDRHAGRHGRPPACIGARIERAVEHHARDLARCIGADLGRHRARMPLGRGPHRLVPRPDHAAGLTGHQRRQPDQRLHRQVQFRAEPAARRRRHDPHLLLRQAQDCRRVVPVHHRRLRTGLDDQRVAFHPGDARLRFDIGVLDIGGLEGRFGHERCVRERFVRVAGRDAPLDQFVARPGLMQARAGRPFGLRRGMRTRSPGDREGRKIEWLDHLRRTDDKCHRLAEIPHRMLGQRRLIGQRRDHSEPVHARNILCSQYPDAQS